MIGSDTSISEELGNVSPSASFASKDTDGLFVSSKVILLLQGTCFFEDFVGCHARPPTTKQHVTNNLQQKERNAPHPPKMHVSTTLEGVCVVAMGSEGPILALRIQ